MELVLLTALGVGGATILGVVIGFIFKGMFYMTELELKRYALIGLIVRIRAEQERLQKITDEKIKNGIKYDLNKMLVQYNELRKELLNIE